jgi:hypothetical protein
MRSWSVLGMRSWGALGMRSWSVGNGGSGEKVACVPPLHERGEGDRG